MENIDVDGTPFSILMDRAVKIKCLQSKRDRVKYDAFPAFYANTIYPNDEVTAVRRCSTFKERLDAAYRMKGEGNLSFRNGCFHDAVTKYGMAVSVFRYLDNTYPDWKSMGSIEDRFIREIEYECKDDTERRNLDQLLSNCYTNIALASCKLKDYLLAIQACDYAISVNGRNDKAYFVRARARLTPKSSSWDDQQLARSDLLIALTLNPENREAKDNLSKLIRVMNMQKVKEDISYKGFFGRVEIYDREHGESTKGNSKCNIKDMIDSKQRDVLLGQRLAQLYNERGMYKEQERIEQCIQYEVASMKQLNFRNPSPQMVLEADSMGINLKDPQTVELLEQIKDGVRTFEFEQKSEKANSCSLSASFVPDFRAVEQKCIAVFVGLVIAGSIVAYLN